MSPVSTRRGLVVLALISPMGAACQTGPAPVQDRPRSVSESKPPAKAPSSAVASATAEQDLITFRRLFALSDQGDAFLSDNLVSNETSYLDAGPVLLSRQGGAYLGVGPEQNYSYLALGHPELALLVDLRRDNALLHLLYKATFESAVTRGVFLSLLLGRPLGNDLESLRAADAETVIRTVEAHAPDGDWFRQRHAELSERIRGYGLGLSARDFEHIDAIHQKFFARQLDLGFELHRQNGRVYPTLRSLLTARTESGIGSFMATEEGFGWIRSLVGRHRVVPIVCNVSSPQPLGAIGSELRRQGLKVTAFYIGSGSHGTALPAVI